jgi:hypothetical protein
MPIFTEVIMRRSSLFLLAAVALACKPEPTQPIAKPEPPCASADACLQASSEARNSLDTTRQMAVLEYSCATYPAGLFCLQLSQLYLSTPPEDRSREREVLRASCTSVAPDVCARLAVMAYKGEGGEVDQELALSSAKLGCSDAGRVEQPALRGEACWIISRTTQQKDKDLSLYFERGCLFGNESCCEADAPRRAAKEEADKRAEEEKRANEEAAKKAQEAKATEEAAKKASPLPDANLTIGEITSDGLSLKDIACKTEGRVGLLGTLTVVAGLSKRKDKLDACYKGQTETQVHFWQSGGKISKAEALGPDAKVNKCVVKAVLGAPSTMDSECFATITHGK